MTTLAALLARCPGAGTRGGVGLRYPLGMTIIGGLLLSQFLTLYTTPAIYLALERLSSRVAGVSGMAPATDIPREPTPSLGLAATRRGRAPWIHPASPASRLRSSCAPSERRCSPRDCSSSARVAYLQSARREPPHCRLPNPARAGKPPRRRSGDNGGDQLLPRSSAGSARSPA